MVIDPLGALVSKQNAAKPSIPQPSTTDSTTTFHDPLASVVSNQTKNTLSPSSGGLLGLINKAGQASEKYIHQPIENVLSGIFKVGETPVKFAAGAATGLVQNIQHLTSPQSPAGPNIKDVTKFATEQFHGAPDLGTQAIQGAANESVASQSRLTQAIAVYKQNPIKQNLDALKLAFARASTAGAAEPLTALTANIASNLGNPAAAAMGYGFNAITPGAKPISIGEATLGMVNKPKVSPSEVPTDFNAGSPTVIPDASQMTREEAIRSGFQPNGYNLPGGVSGDGATSPRSFLQTIQNSANSTPEEKAIAAALPQEAPIIHNAESFGAAQERVKNIDTATKYFLDPSVPFSAEKSATGELLGKTLIESGQTGKGVEVLDSLTNQGRTAGQGIQAMSGWSQLSPRAFLNVADNAAESVGKTLPEEFRNQIAERATAIQKLAQDSPERLRATEQLLQDVANNLPTTGREWFQNYRFQNMLSAPASAEKIGYGSLFNTMVTRPVDLFGKAVVEAAKSGFGSTFERTVYFSDIPKWYKNVILGMPRAWEAAVGSFRAGQMGQTFTDATKGSQIINAARKANIPVLARPFSSLHGAIYSYFSSIISGAEKARLLSNGVAEGEASRLAQELGDKLTLRSPLGQKDGPALVRAVDFLGNMVQNATKKGGVVGETSGWIAPFMKVSTNWAKLAVEHSPLALLDKPSNITSDTISKAFVGSVATGIGAYIAAQGRVTLAAPTDQKASDAFYASGRKPYSVLIGNQWIPLTYFGPFSLALALPEIFRNRSVGSNAGKTEFQKDLTLITGVSRFVVANTPLPSITSFFNFLNGDTNVNPSKIAADTASQVIPLEAALRYLTQIIDPQYRKTKDFTSRIESAIPLLSKKLPGYTTPAGKPETRNASRIFAPYQTGTNNPVYSQMLKNRNNALGQNPILNQYKKGGMTINQLNQKLKTLKK